MAGPLKQAREDDVLFPPEPASDGTSEDLGLPAFALVVGAIAGFVLGALLSPVLARLLHQAVPERLFHALFVIGGGLAGWRVWTESLAGLTWTPPEEQGEADARETATDGEGEEEEDGEGEEEGEGQPLSASASPAPPSPAPEPQGPVESGGAASPVAAPDLQDRSS